MDAERERDWLEDELRVIVRRLHNEDLDVETKMRLVQDRDRLEARIDEIAALAGGSQDAEATVDDVLMTAWVLLANVSEGDWTQQTEEWQEAVRRWRDEDFHPRLRLAGGSS